MDQFFRKNLRFDFNDIELGARLEIHCRFIVNGKVTGIWISKSAGSRAYDNEVPRVVSMMPRLNPGKQNGHKVKVYFNLPVVVVIPEQ